MGTKEARNMEKVTFERFGVNIFWGYDITHIKPDGSKEKIDKIIAKIEAESSRICLRKELEGEIIETVDISKKAELDQRMYETMKKRSEDYARENNLPLENWADEGRAYVAKIFNQR